MSGLDTTPAQMHREMGLFIGRFMVGVLLWLAFAPAVAVAQVVQPWLNDRRYGERDGVRSGTLVLHPTIAAEVGYDSNFYQGAGALDDEPVVAVAGLRVTPALAIRTFGAEEAGSTAAPPKVIVGASVAGRLRQQVAVGRQFEEDVAGETLIGGDARLSLDIHPKRRWGSALSLALSRSIQPNKPGLVGIDNNAFGGSFLVKWRPGGGVLEWGWGYRARVTVYDEAAFGLNRLNHGVRTEGRWRFLPRTSVIYQGDVGFVSHLQAGTRQLNSRPISSQLGINGLVTPRFGLLFMAGWKGTFYEPDALGQIDDFDGPIGRAELTWYLGGVPEKNEGGRHQVGLSTIRVGIQRDVQNSAISNYYELNRAYFDTAYFIGGVASISFRAGLSLVRHPPPVDDDGQGITVGADGRPEKRELNEVRPDANLHGEYRLLPGLSMLASFGYNASLTNNRIVVVRRNQAYDNLKFSRVTSFFGVRWFN